MSLPDNDDKTAAAIWHHIIARTTAATAMTTITKMTTQLLESHSMSLPHNCRLLQVELLCRGSVTECLCRAQRVRVDRTVHYK